MKDTEFLYVKTIVEEKSFSKASKKLGVSQPALSAYINKLEKKIGAQLFDRSISPIGLTEVGQCYLEYACSVLDAAERFDIMVSDLSELKTGKIVIGTTYAFSSCYLPNATASFLQKYPGVNIIFEQGRVPDIQAKCLDGDVDLFISDANIDPDLFCQEKLFDERIIVMVPLENPINEELKQFQVPVDDIIQGTIDNDPSTDLDLSLLKNEKFILLYEAQHIRKISDDLCLRSGFKPKEAMQVPQMMTNFALTLAGVGISFISESAVRYGNIKKHPVYYKLDKAYSSRSISVAYKSKKYLPKACRLFIEELKKSLYKKITVYNIP